MTNVEFEGLASDKMNFSYDLNEVLPLSQGEVVKIGHDLLPVGSSSNGTCGGKTFFLLQVKTYFTFKLVQRESAFLNKGVLRSRGVHYSDVFINQVISFSIDHYISGKHI